jgi:hypothetical protein
MRLAILPNIVETLVAQTTRTLSAAILDISAVGFLGLGAQSPQPEWGAMLADSSDLIYLAPWTVTLPGMAILFSVLVTNLVGEGIREALKEGMTDAMLCAQDRHAHPCPRIVRRAGQPIAAKAFAKHSLMPLLDIRNLTIEIDTPQGKVKAVDKVSLTLAEGDPRPGGRIRLRQEPGGQGDRRHPEGQLDGARRPDALQRHGLADHGACERRRIMGREIAMIFQDPISCLDPSEEIGTQLEEAIPTDSFEGQFWQRFQWRKKKAIALLHRVGVRITAR